MKYLWIFIVLIIIAGLGYYWWHKHNESTSMMPVTTTEAPMQAATSTYNGAGFSIVYPSDYTLNSAYQYTEVANKPIAGVSFTIDPSIATGTNLDADSYVSVETLPRAKECTGDIYLPQNVKSTTVTEDGLTYSLATSSEGAAGSFVEEDVYAIPGSSPCTAVRYYIHYADINNFPPGTVQQFDEPSLLSAFDTIRDSLTLTPQATMPTQ